MDDIDPTQVILHSWGHIIILGHDGSFHLLPSTILSPDGLHAVFFHVFKIPRGIGVLYISSGWYVDYMMVIAREIAGHVGPGTGRQPSITVHTLPLQSRIVESKVATGKAVKGSQLHCAIGIHIAQGSIWTVIGARRTGIWAIPVVDTSILKVRLKLSYVII